MSHHNQDLHNLHRSTLDRAATEPVRTRWTPKPEQILILESIFNSGMVNPRKDETVKIRKLLEKFGAVGDANVFYWFQNRRSRCRRRQRQLQASQLAASDAVAAQIQAGSGVLQEPMSSSPYNNSYGEELMFPCPSTAAADAYSSNSSNVFMVDECADDLFSITRQMGYLTNAQTTSESDPFVCSSDVSQLHHQPETVMVFIDGVLNEVPRGPIDLRSMFGENVILLHSSGELLPANEHGILTQSLQMGESYFLVVLNPPEKDANHINNFRMHV
ncbi:WUSCHEL-related homeobox 11-like [Canna indica]|uniref:WUSCHEL-related homeobox 11-like n=1 Tax=Canna indica TaxID=4628 RepID=A0AAQ3QDL4_9LILI|nr:WUSCHEL-related homeobox 11-like [Canna indica]